MNKRVIVYVLGAVLLIEAALMLLPLLVAVIYREKNGWYFLWVLLGAAVLGALALGLGGRKRSAMYAKEGLIAVALSWIVLSLVGAAVHAVGADPVLPRRGVRDDLRLYDHGFQHPPGGRVA